MSPLLEQGWGRGALAPSSCPQGAPSAGEVRVWSSGWGEPAGPTPPHPAPCALRAISPFGPHSARAEFCGLHQGPPPGHTPVDPALTSLVLMGSPPAGPGHSSPCSAPTPPPPPAPPWAPSWKDMFHPTQVCTHPGHPSGRAGVLPSWAPVPDSLAPDGDSLFPARPPSPRAQNVDTAGSGPLRLLPSLLWKEECSVWDREEPHLPAGRFAGGGRARGPGCSPPPLSPGRVASHQAAAFVQTPCAGLQQQRASHTS